MEYPDQEKQMKTIKMIKIRTWRGEVRHLEAINKDLLEVCEQSLTWIKAGQPDYGQEMPLIKQLEQAISKAEGRE